MPCRATRHKPSDSRLRVLLAALLLSALASACASTLPSRFVIEQDLGGYRYRRYQSALDVEIPVADNPATAHMATYVKAGTPLSIAPVSVTRYASANGLNTAIRGVLRGMEGYTYGVVEVEGQWLWRLDGEQQDSWLLWTSGRSLVKLGAPEGADVPRTVTRAYLSTYPSDLDAEGKAQAP